MNGYKCKFRVYSPSGGLVETATIIYAPSNTEAERILKEQYSVANVISIIGGYGEKDK